LVWEIKTSLTGSTNGPINVAKDIVMGWRFRNGNRVRTSRDRKVLLYYSNPDWKRFVYFL